MNIQEIWTGRWDYRSYNNYSFELEKEKGSLEFGSGTIVLDSTEYPNQIVGSIGDPERQSWELQLTGCINYGDPFSARFQGEGIVGESKWIYEYISYMINPWQNGVNQVPAFVGSVIRQIPHPGGDGTIHHAGVVASFYCVKSI